jgi:hypothetical protein
MRVFVFDNTQSYLTASWWIGSLLRSLRKGRDMIFSVESWADMVKQLEPLKGVKRVEYWGHGSMGSVSCDHRRMGPDVLPAVKHIMDGPESLWWWRTCSSFRAERGRAFAQSCASTLECRVAGFQHTIWMWQSGLQVATPNEVPDWDDEGGKWSKPWMPNTVFCMSKGPFPNV